jgi:hypothetical protein
MPRSTRVYFACCSCHRRLEVSAGNGRQSSRGSSEMSDAYRQPTNIMQLTHRHFGPFTKCPACDAMFEVRAVCADCQRTFTLVDWPNERYCVGCRQSGLSDLPKRLGSGKMIFKGYTNITFCSPSKRIKVPHTWFRKCSEPGDHIHQSCECGWWGLSYVNED